MSEQRYVTDHHDGHGLNERTVIAAGEIGPGGAPDLYTVIVHGAKVDDTAASFQVRFQTGPRDEPGSLAGTTNEALLAIVIDRLRGFQAGQYACRENAIALTHIETALLWLRQRADARAKRGVLGTHKT